MGTTINPKDWDIQLAEGMPVTVCTRIGWEWGESGRGRGSGSPGCLFCAIGAARRSRGF